MLQRLLVQNFALIDRVDLQFGPNLNLLTGETGAGKSLLVDAIGLILGKRADPSVLFDANQKCIVEAEFALAQEVLAGIQEALLAEEADAEALPDLNDTLLVLRREIAPGGRSRAFVNDTPVTLTLLKAITSRVVDLHGQHDGLQLLAPGAQLAVLDQYAAVSDDARAFGRDLVRWKQLQEEVQQLKGALAEARKQQDYYEYQFKELDAAELKDGEDEAIEAQLSAAQNAETILEALSHAVQLIEGEENGLAPMLKGAARELERMSVADPRLSPEAERLQDLRFQLEEVAGNLRQLAEETELDPEKAATLHARLDTYNKLKVKFAVRTAAELIVLRDDFATKLEAYAETPERIAALEQEIGTLSAQLEKRGLKLEKARMKAAEVLTERAQRLFPEVGLPKAVFTIKVERRKAATEGLVVDGTPVECGPRGFNTVEFRIQTNPGVGAGTLQQVASGGELSRVMLALKTALAEKLALSVLIFDEIDTGISGETAMKVGRTLQNLSEGHQVLAITHLPQIASRPGMHFFIRKEQQADRTFTRIEALDDNARVEQIARMMAGDRITDSALANARDLMHS